MRLSSPGRGLLLGRCGQAGDRGVEDLRPALHAAHPHGVAPGGGGQPAGLDEAGGVEFDVAPGRKGEEAQNVRVI